MTKQNKNHNDQITLEEIVKSGRQLILKHDDGMEQLGEELANQSGKLKSGATMKVIEMDKSGFDNEPTKSDPTLTNTIIRTGGINSEAPGFSRRR